MNDMNNEELLVKQLKKENIEYQKQIKRLHQRNEILLQENEHLRRLFVPVGSPLYKELQEKYK